MATSIGPAQRLCANHPERPGHALCMSCRRAMCQECATEWDGINYCVACLARRRAAARTSSSLLGWAAVVLAALALLYASVQLMLWAGLFVAGLV